MEISWRYNGPISSDLRQCVLPLRKFEHIVYDDSRTGVYIVALMYKFRPFESRILYMCVCVYVVIISQKRDRASLRGIGHV